MCRFFDSLPEVLAARDLRELARSIARARRGGRTFLLMMGAHPLKVGLGPIICDLLPDRILSAIATNAAPIIHDFELPPPGRTSDDWGLGLPHARFRIA